MDILDDTGVSKLSAKVFLKVNYSFNPTVGFVHNPAFFRAYYPELGVIQCFNGCILVLMCHMTCSADPVILVHSDNTAVPDVSLVPLRRSQHTALQINDC